MNEESRKEEAQGGVVMPAAEVERLLELLGATGEVHPDLERVLREPQAKQIVEEIISDEIQDPGA
jgi:hypothetical protein